MGRRNQERGGEHKRGGERGEGAKKKDSRRKRRTLKFGKLATQKTSTQKGRIATLPGS